MITNSKNKIRIFTFSHRKLCDANVKPSPRNRNACNGIETCIILLTCVSVINANKSVSQMPLQAPQAAAIT